MTASSWATGRSATAPRRGRCSKARRSRPTTVREASRTAERGLWTGLLRRRRGCHGDGMTTTPPLADVPIRSADELTSRWTMLLNPPEFGARSLWLSWFGADGRMLPVVIPVDDLPVIPDPALVTSLRQVHDSIVEHHLDGDGHLTMALCRPGGPTSVRTTTPGS